MELQLALDLARVPLAAPDDDEPMPESIEQRHEVTPWS
jgi:hypothetical protein